MSRAKICRGNFSDLSNDDLCFVVRPEVPEDTSSTIFFDRAEACLDMSFDYDAASSNCETFANAVVGRWAKGHQASENAILFEKSLSDVCFQTPTGAVQKVVKGFTKATKIAKDNEALLLHQMYNRFRAGNLMLPFENIDLSCL